MSKKYEMFELVFFIGLFLGVGLGIIFYEYSWAGPTRVALQVELDQQKITGDSLQKVSNYKLYYIYPPDKLHNNILVYDVFLNWSSWEPTGNAAVISSYSAFNNTILVFYPGIILLEKPIIVKGSNVIFDTVEHFKTILLPTPDFNNYTFSAPLIVYGKNFIVNGLNATAFFRVN